MTIATRIAPYLAGVLMAAGLGAASASADIMSATYAGTLNYGVDAVGLFGEAGVSMVGQGFEVNYTYDTNLGVIHPFSAGTFLQGGGYMGTPLFMSAVSMKIGSTTVAMTPPVWFGQAELVPDHHLQDPQNHATAAACHDAQQSVNGGPSFYACIHTLDAVPADYNTAFSVQGDPLSNGLVAFLFGDMTLQGKADSLVVARLGASPIEVGVDVGVPEASTWALMIVGFGGAGAMLRRTPRKAAARA